MHVISVPPYAFDAQHNVVILKVVCPFFVITPPSSIILLMLLSFLFYSTTNKIVETEKIRVCWMNEPVSCRLLSAQIRHDMFFYSLIHGMEWNEIILIFIYFKSKLTSLPVSLTSWDRACVWIEWNWIEQNMSLSVFVWLCVTIC